MHIRPRNYRGRTIVPLTHHPGPLQAYKQIFPGRGCDAAAPDPVTHGGYEWFYALSGRLRLILGERDVVLAAGEVAEFDTQVPHKFGSADHQPAEILNPKDIEPTSPPTNRLMTGRRPVEARHRQRHHRRTCRAALCVNLR